MTLFSEEMRRNPYPLYDQMRSASPLFRDPQSRLWMIFDYEGVKKVLNDHDTFSSKLGPADWLVFRGCAAPHQTARAHLTGFYPPLGREPRAAHPPVVR